MGGAAAAATGDWGPGGGGRGKLTEDGQVAQRPTRGLRSPCRSTDERLSFLFVT